MPVKIATLERMLCIKLEAVQSQGGNHTKYAIWHEGQKVAATVLSRSYAEISDSLAGRIARELHVNRGQLNLLIDCPMSRADYISHVLGE